ncbi:MAG: methyltransferase, partial [Planctomycetes bacterium]|nr:methyltransferase [Planctomycetota bacterium]
MTTPRADAACRSCGASDLMPFLSLGNMPLVDAFVREEDLAKPDPRFPLDVALCPGCSLVQILDTVPPETLFVENYQYFSSFSDALLDHSRRNVEALIASRRLHEGSLVVELASNDG